MAKTSETGDAWAAGMVKRVGLAIKAARQGRSAAWLSDRTAELGYRISPTVIAKLDSGHRGTVLGVAELLVIAAALDVPPLALLFPDLPDGTVELLPGRPNLSFDAYMWTVGTTPYPQRPGAKLIQAAIQLDSLRRELGALEMADLSGDDRVHGRAFRMRLAEIREQIDAAEATIRECGGVLDA